MLRAVEHPRLLAPLALGFAGLALWHRVSQAKTFLYADLQHFFQFADTLFTARHFDYYQSVAEAHDSETAIVSALREGLDRPVQVLVHHDPCVPNCCSTCAVENCDVRQDSLTVQKRLDPEEVTHQAAYLDPA